MLQLLENIKRFRINRKNIKLITVGFKVKLKKISEIKDNLSDDELIILK